MKEDAVQRTVVKWLSKNKWTDLDFGATHEHGVDIKARKGNRIIFVEVKGESVRTEGNEVNFIYGLGQLVTRMKVVDAPRAITYALGFPTVTAKKALRRIPWKFAKKLCVEIFSVSASGNVHRYTWKDLKETQKK